MRANQAVFRIATMSRVLGVSPSGYYAWRKRGRSAREASDEALSARVRAIHERSRGTYGAPRIHAELSAEGTPVSRKRVARVMRAAGLAGVSRRKGPRTTRRDPQGRPAPDLVERCFEAEAPDRLWVADITYVATDAGFMYLAIVLDVFSRRVVGWAMANHLRTELVLDALDMAVGQRRPDSVIHHSDQGCQYTSLAFGEAAGDGVWRHRWARSVTASTTPWRRASSPPWNVSCSTEHGSTTIATHRGKYSRISRGGIILTAVTKAWVTSLRSTSRSPVRKLHDTQAINRPLKRSNSNERLSVACPSSWYAPLPLLSSCTS